MTNPLHSKIDQQVKSTPVVIYMKGTPDEPMCGFSAKACDVLRAAGVKELVGVNVLDDDALWGALEEYTQWPTVPQIFVHGQFVGGCDIVSEMYSRGELQDLLSKKS